MRNKFKFSLVALSILSFALLQALVQGKSSLSVSERAQVLWNRLVGRQQPSLERQQSSPHPPIPIKLKYHHERIFNDCSDGVSCGTGGTAAALKAKKRKIDGIWGDEPDLNGKIRIQRMEMGGSGRNSQNSILAICISTALIAILMVGTWF